MLWTIAAILPVLSLPGMVTFHALGLYVHILMVLAIIAVLISFKDATLHRQLRAVEQGQAARENSESQNGPARSRPRNSRPFVAGSAIQLLT